MRHVLVHMFYFFTKINVSYDTVVVMAAIICIWLIWIITSVENISLIKLILPTWMCKNLAFYVHLGHVFYMVIYR